MALKAVSLKSMNPGRHPDGRYGLYFNVKPTGARSWLQRLTIDGRRKTFGLGPYPVVSLAEARDAAIDNVRMLRKGINPIVARKHAARVVPTFAEAADAYIRLQAAGWKAGSRNEDNWRSSLAHAAPIADSPVDIIMTDDVAAIATGLLQDGKAPTAKALRQRIRLVFDWCIAQGHRVDNPANGAIDAILPKSGHRTKHHESISIDDVAGVYAAAADIADPKWIGLTGAFRLLVLTACRTSEVLGAQWNEIDMDARTWTIPAARMKAKRAHRIPLCAEALVVLEAARKRTGGKGRVFLSPSRKAIGDDGLRRVMRRIEAEGTVHGFRGTFKTWCMEAGVSRDIAEFSIAHNFMGDVEASYVRTDLLEKRRPVMERWGRHVAGTTAPVVVAISGAAG